MRTSFILFGVVAWLGLPAQSHEFWLSPRDYQVDPGATLEVSFRVGSDMKGSTMIYLPGDSMRFDLALGGTLVPVISRIGDEPALVAPAGAEGLAVVIYQTDDAHLRYEKWEVFQHFVALKDFTGVIDRHLARGLPQTGFIESFRRHCKTLIAVGAGAGADREFGLRLEFVALNNPYTDDLAGGFAAVLLRNGVAWTDTQVAVYATAPDASVSRLVLRSDAAGRVVVPVRPGTEYLLDAVEMLELPNGDPAAGPVWHSDWTSLTFRTPD